MDENEALVEDFYSEEVQLGRHDEMGGGAENGQKGEDQQTIMKVSMFAMLKQIWIDRNDIIFKRSKPNKNRSWDKIVEISFFWMCNRSRSISIGWNHWISNPLVKD